MTVPPTPARKPIRLSDAAYAVPGSAWLVTIGTADRVPAFTTPELAHAVMALLEDRCAAMGSTLETYCLMPDHLHLSLHITEGNLIDIIRDAKSRTTRL
jgi:putative transposase